MHGPVLRPVRGTELDGIFVGLWLEGGHGRELASAGFDAAYTYFASTGFVWGSTPAHWKRMCEQAAGLGIGCILSVGPGYADEGIRPWNGHNSKPRGANGEYYRAMMGAAMAAKPTAISITSYNEWGEGTQIEPAVPHTAGGRVYQDYGSAGPGAYLNMTRGMLAAFREGRGRAEL